MAKKKTRILWLSRDRCGYQLWEEKPKWSKLYNHWGALEELYEFCAYDFLRLFPTLKLRKEAMCKLKLTQLKNGIKLEKVK